MTEWLEITAPKGPIRAEITLPASKSEANRALIIQALSGGKVQVENLPDSEDVRVMQAALGSRSDAIDIGHAGTAMRFLTAYFAVQPRDLTLSGSARMHQRPIGPLVEALRRIGAKIDYLGTEGFPPLRIRGSAFAQRNDEVEITSEISSQFVSALMMIAPVLPRGLRIRLTGRSVMSESYIRLTAHLMSRAGIQPADQDADYPLEFETQEYSAATLKIPADWSAASYWFSIAGLSPGCDLLLRGLHFDTRQGDREIAAMLREYGVAATEVAEGVRLASDPVLPPKRAALHFSSCPDIAQTMAAFLAGAGGTAFFSGIESLRIKETDRIAALQAELAKFGVDFQPVKNADRKPGEDLLARDGFRDGEFLLHAGFVPAEARIRTYHDHRMAMAFAPLALKTGKLWIEDPEVVKKSYPGFWEELRKAGFGLKKIQAGK